MTFRQPSLGWRAALPTPTSMCLQLSADKTELLWFSSVSQLCQLPPQTSTVHVNQCTIKPATVIRDLGTWFDAKLSICSHVLCAVQTCFCHLHHRLLGRGFTARLVMALLVLLHLDYCNAVLAGCPASTLALFQWVLHAATCTVQAATMWPRLSKSYTGYQLQRGSSWSCARWYTSHLSDVCQSICRTQYSLTSVADVCQRDLQCTVCLVIWRTRCHVDTSMVWGLFLSPHRKHGTGCQ